MIISNQSTNRISLSIIPSYYCSQNCEYCYLGDNRKDKTVASLEDIKARLNELNDYTITSISIYGGEVSELPFDYLQQLIDICKQYCQTIGIASNLYNKAIIEFCKSNNVGLLVSYNEERPDYKRVKNVIKTIDCTVGVVALPSIIKRDIDDLIREFDDIGNDVYLFEYYQTKHTKYKFDIKQFTDWVIKFITRYNETRPHNWKIKNLDEWTDQNYNPDDSGFIYIMPSGKYGTVVYDIDHNESHIEFDSLEQWKNHCNKQHLTRLTKCCSCQYFTQCKAEHLVVYNDEYCSGLQKVVELLS